MTQQKKRMTLRLPAWLDAEIEAKAQEESISKNAIIIRACRELVEQYERARKEKKEWKKTS